MRSVSLIKSVVWPSSLGQVKVESSFGSASRATANDECRWSRLARGKLCALLSEGWTSHLADYIAGLAVEANAADVAVEITLVRPKHIVDVHLYGAAIAAF